MAAILSILKNVLSLILLVLTFINQTAYSFALCYCHHSEKYSMTISGLGEDCCDKKKEALPSCSPHKTLNCCQKDSGSPLTNCCTHEEIVIKHTDAAVLKSKKILTLDIISQSLLSSVSSTFLYNNFNFEKYYQFPLKLITHPDQQAFLCIWRN